VRYVLALVLAALTAGLVAHAARPGALREPSLLAVGDSLSVGAAPYLERELDGYEIRVSHRVGLFSAEVARRVQRARSPLPRVLVVSAGTNDHPREVERFASSVSTVLGAAGRSRCVVWPKIVRPPVGGTTYAGLNRELVRAARKHANLVLVDWPGIVRRSPRLLRADGVHATAAGYRARAAAIARAVTTRCR
jgi:lysophospholipase L1-like esterase